MNEYGLDVGYFEKIIKRELSDISCFKPDEFARVCLRMAMTASSETINEKEFSGAIKAEAVREASSLISSGAIEETHKYMVIENRYVYVSTRSLREYADKLERGEA